MGNSASALSPANGIRTPGVVTPSRVAAAAPFDSRRGFSPPSALSFFDCAWDAALDTVRHTQSPTNVRFVMVSLSGSNAEIAISNPDVG
jgi:hypothetical protein